MSEFKPKLESILEKEETLLDVEQNKYEGCGKCLAGYISPGVMCDCFKLEIRKRKYKNSNIDYEFASIEIFDEDLEAYIKDGDDKIKIKINPFMDDYVDNHKENIKNGYGFIINGPTGRGKSVVAMKILMRLNDLGYKCYFTTIKNFLEIIKKSWDDEEHENLLNYIYNCDFLVIDDLGTELHRTDWTITEIDAIFRHRYFKKKPTLMTTNSTLNALKEKYAQRIISLFHERSLMITIVSKEDYRKKTSKIPDYFNLDSFKDVDKK